jgi:uracil-DNA glycosylase
MGKFKIALVGEAYGEEEERYKRPFIGRAGEQLDELLADAGILRSDCFITNCFNLRPERNDLSTLCVRKSEGGYVPKLPPLLRGLYLKNEYAGELVRLFEELNAIQPNVVVLLGNTAVWAILRAGAISKIRGTCSISPYLPGIKLLPTYHPANALRQYENRHITVLDLQKAKRESEFPELRRPMREIWMDPTIEDLECFYQDHLLPARRIAFDVETAFQQVTCLGLAPDPTRALVLPLLDYRFPGGHYFKEASDEVLAWAWLKKALNIPGVKYVAQNGLYDLQYIWRTMGIPVSLSHDTMLLHHALQPESRKSLGFLGSVYCNEIAWKPQRPKGKHAEKPGDSE